MITKLRGWWSMGSPVWRRLVGTAAIAVAAFAAAQVLVLLQGNRVLAFALVALTCVAAVCFLFTLMAARARGEGAYSPGWYRRFQESARAGR